MTPHKNGPDAVNAGAKITDAAKQDFYNILPPVSQALAPLLREAEGAEKALILNRLKFFMRHGVPENAHCEIHLDGSPDHGTLIEMSLQSERLMVLVLNWRPSIVFNMATFTDIVTRAFNSDPMRDAILYDLRHWKDNSAEFTDARNRTVMVENLTEEHEAFGEIMRPLVDAPHDPRHWQMPPLVTCPVFVAPAPERKAAR